MKLSKVQRKNLYIVTVVIALAVILYMRSNSGKGSYTIYGSESCPWTVKALEHAKNNNHDYSYVDCKKETCPSFVNGFPTYKNNTTGKVASGFTTDPHSI